MGDVSPDGKFNVLGERSEFKVFDELSELGVEFVGEVDVQGFFAGPLRHRVGSVGVC